MNCNIKYKSVDYINNHIFISKLILGDFSPIGYWSKAQNDDFSKDNYLELNLRNTALNDPPGFLSADEESFQSTNSIIVNNDYDVDKDILPEEIIGKNEVLIVDALLVSKS